MGRLADDVDGELPSFEQFYEEMRISIQKWKSEPIAILD